MNEPYMNNEAFWARQQAYAARRSYVRRCANTGIAVVLLMFAVQVAASVLLYLPPLAGLAEWVYASDVGYILFSCVLYTLMMGTPILVGRLLLPRTVRIVPRGKVAAGELLLLCVAGMSMTSVANIGNAYVLQFFAQFGLLPVDYGTTQDGTFGIFLLNLVMIAVLPCLLEEFLFRGVVLQALRPAGDGVAVFASALIFALMHTNLQQIPFAFVLGLVFGYITVHTGSILPAILIHFLNNAFSVTLEYLTFHQSETAANIVINTVFAIELLLGIVATAVLLLRNRAKFHTPGTTPTDPLSNSERRKLVFRSPAMIVFVILTLLMAIPSVEFAPPGSYAYNEYFGIEENAEDFENWFTQDGDETLRIVWPEEF